MKKRLLNILFWSVLSAAFIGPGTITTAASAGASFGYTLLWALTFSTIACIILQEASSRITTVSGINLGEAIRKYWYDQLWGKTAVYLILLAIVLGCTAYEAGNILGAIAGASLILHIPYYWLTIVIGVLAFILFGFGTVDLIAKVMGVIVGFMGICFLTTAIIMKPPILDILSSGIIPHFPNGSEMLVLALVGTTVVPYNIFLGSGLASDQSLKDMRLNLGIAIGLGGIISMGVLVVGASISGSFTFQALANQLSDQLGSWAATFFGIGLFCAGFSSSITAPLAAAITSRSLLANEENKSAWSNEGRYFRFVWIAVLIVGLAFGINKAQPIPIIILAQALNGIILPLVAIILFLMVNNISLLKADHINSNILNFFTGVVIFITVILGVTNIFKAITKVLQINLIDESIILVSAVLVTLLIAYPVYRKMMRLRDGKAKKTK